MTEIKLMLHHARSVALHNRIVPGSVDEKITRYIYDGMYNKCSIPHSVYT